MYAHIERLAILHISKFICTLEKQKNVCFFRNPGLKRIFRVNGFTKTVTLRLRSIGPNVQRHMAYFAAANESVCV